MKDRNVPKLRHLHWCTDQLMSDGLSKLELTASQACAMGYISHQKAPPVARDLEQALHLSHASTAGILQRLERKDFIAFQTDPNDQRCKRIHVQPKGRACSTHMHSAMDAIEQQLVQGFSPEEKELFARLLERAIRNMGGIPPIHKEASKK